MYSLRISNQKKNICIVNGIERDLSFCVDGKHTWSECIKIMNSLTGGCFETVCEAVGKIYDSKEIPKYLTIQTKEEYITQNNIQRCPTCGSTNVQKISAGSRWLSTGLFGLGSSKVGKTMECRNCGYKW